MLAKFPTSLENCESLFWLKCSAIKLVAVGVNKYDLTIKNWAPVKTNISPIVIEATFDMSHQPLKIAALLLANSLFCPVAWRH